MKIRGKKKLGFISKMMIGLGHGLVKTKDVILNEDLGISTQDATDSLSIWIGRELMKEMLERNIVKVKDSDEKLIDALTSVIDVAEELDITVNDSQVEVVVQKCMICPKRVGGYDLGGNTACPVGGLLTGAISYARGTQPLISKNHLVAGEICHINLDLKQ